MSAQGLRFTLNIDGLAETTMAVVNFRLVQHYSRPFMLKVDIASSLPEGMHILEVRVDIAQKVAGGLGIQSNERLFSPCTGE